MPHLELDHRLNVALQGVQVPQPRNLRAPLRLLCGLRQVLEGAPARVARNALRMRRLLQFDFHEFSHSDCRES